MCMHVYLQFCVFLLTEYPNINKIFLKLAQSQLAFVLYRSGAVQKQIFPL